MTMRCCACGHNGPPETKDFGNGLSGRVCSNCDSEDIFRACPACKTGVLDDHQDECSDEDCEYNGKTWDLPEERPDLPETIRG